MTQSERAPSHPVATFIIPNYNGGAMLKDCLDSILAQTVANYEVLVVDNASADNSINLPHFNDQRFILIRLDSNLGFAQACNKGLMQARAPVVALINNDAVINQSWLEKILTAFKENPNAGSVACRIVIKNKPNLLDSAGFALCKCGSAVAWRGLPADSFIGKNHQVFGPSAAAAAYRYSALLQTGFFLPEFFAYYEDADLACRLVWLGFPCIYIHDAVAHHHGSATSQKGSNFQRRMLRRNAELLFWINMQGSLALRNILAHTAYELICMMGMLRNGQILVFLQSKIGFIKLIPRIMAYRSSLRQKLVKGRSPSKAEFYNMLTDNTECIKERMRERSI